MSFASSIIRRRFTWNRSCALNRCLSGGPGTWSAFGGGWRRGAPTWPTRLPRRGWATTWTLAPWAGDTAAATNTGMTALMCGARAAVPAAVRLALKNGWGELEARD